MTTAATDVTAYPEYQQFIDAAADDLRVWLIFADWLDEHGDSRRAADARRLPELIEDARRLCDPSSTTAHGAFKAFRDAAKRFAGVSETFVIWPTLDDFIAMVAEREATTPTRRAEQVGQTEADPEAAARKSAQKRK